MDNNEPDNGPKERNYMSTTRRRRIIGSETDAQETPSSKDGDDLKPTENSSRSRTRTLSNQPSSENKSKSGRQQRTRARSLKSTTPPTERPKPPTARKPKVGDTRRPSGNGTEQPATHESEATKPPRKKRRRGGKGRAKNHENPQRQQKGGRDTAPVEATIDDTPVVLDEHQLERRRGKERKGRPVGRYQMLVHVHE